VETGAAIDIKSGLAREKMEKSKTRDGRPIGRKDVPGDGLVFTSNFLDEIQGDRIPSQKSTISDTADSSGGGLVVVAQEPPTSMMADDMIRIVIDIWDGSIPLSFSPPERPIYLTWQSYQSLHILADYRGSSGAEYSFGRGHATDQYHRVWALNDGSLRFGFNPRDTDKDGYWSRQLACLALEVRLFQLFHIVSFPHWY